MPKTPQNSLIYSWSDRKHIQRLNPVYLLRGNSTLQLKYKRFLMKKICFLLVLLLITSVFSGCIGQKQPEKVNNTSTDSYNSNQSGHSGILSMLFWSSLWNRHVTPNIQAAKSYVTPNTATKTDAPAPSKKVDAKDPTDTTNKNSVSTDAGNKPKPKVKTSTTRIRRSGRR